jgi:hypothetical protein
MHRLPKQIRPTSAADYAIHFSPIVADVAQWAQSAVYSRMKTAPEGLSIVGPLGVERLWAHKPPRKNSHREVKGLKIRSRN